jgi:hypothetical protein
LGVQKSSELLHAAMEVVSNLAAAVLLTTATHAGNILELNTEIRAAKRMIRCCECATGVRIQDRRPMFVRWCFAYIVGMN